MANSEKHIKNIAICILLIIGCDSKGNNGSNAISATTEKNDADNNNNVDSSEPELLYELFGPSTEAIDIMSMDVQGNYIYFTTMSALMRLLKEGGGEEEPIGERPYAGSPQFLVSDENYLYWPRVAGIVKYNVETRHEEVFSTENYVTYIGLIVGEGEKIYIGGDGTSLQLSMNKEGDDIVDYGVEPNDENFGMAYITLDQTYVYFSGGGRGWSAGKIYRVPKSGGNIEEVTTVPEVDDSNYEHLGPQAGAMVVVDANIFFINHYAASGSLLQYLAVAPASGGETTRLVKLLYTTNTQRIFYDKNRKALYFYASGDQAGILKYDLEKEEMTRLEISKGGLAPLASDEDYLYWASVNKIYRLRKF
jgi:hypothetical protein